MKMGKELEIPFEEYADKRLTIPFEEQEQEEIGETLQQEENIQSKKDCEK